MRTIDVDGISVELDLADGEVVLDAVVLVRVGKFDSPRGTTALAVAAGPDTDLIVQLGMMTQAQQWLLNYSVEDNE